MEIQDSDNSKALGHHQDGRDPDVLEVGTTRRRGGVDILDEMLDKLVEAGLARVDGEDCDIHVVVYGSTIGSDNDVEPYSGEQLLIWRFMVWNNGDDQPTEDTVLGVRTRDGGQSSVDSSVLLRKLVKRHVTNPEDYEILVEHFELEV